MDIANSESKGSAAHDEPQMVGHEGGARCGSSGDAEDFGTADGRQGEADHTETLAGPPPACVEALAAAMVLRVRCNIWVLSLAAAGRTLFHG